MRGRRLAIGHEHFDPLLFFRHGLVDLSDCLKQWNMNSLVLGERDECIQILGKAHASESSAPVNSPFLKIVSEPEGEEWHELAYFFRPNAKCFADFVDLVEETDFCDVE